ncbi:unnamed protein product [Bursaphelenchus okinawaensis]|uniref:DUF148 domain-containing protein n=1 Tax=Bursaphelenchus okinawaensis TaxID=465554 RepID=A0A811L7Z8_9BILA|nr:unnamed protein product [Bursaphelenchus okinawaensis]CAG9117424.1 unnamed protein product [Bursaphelenchus okinawaensis]
MNALAIILMIAPLALAHPHGGQGGGNGTGHGPHGPFSEIFDELTDAQKTQLKTIFQENHNTTKATGKAAIESFIATLSTDLQEKVNASHAAFEQKIAANAAKVATLSSAAQTLYNSVEAVMKDDSITRQEEHEKIKSIIQSADQTALEELKSAGIKGPGFGRGGRGGKSGERYTTASK